MDIANAVYDTGAAVIQSLGDQQKWQNWEMSTDYNSPLVEKYESVENFEIPNRNVCQ